MQLVYTPMINAKVSFLVALEFLKMQYQLSTVIRG